MTSSSATTNTALFFIPFQKKSKTKTNKKTQQF